MTSNKGDDGFSDGKGPARKDADIFKKSIDRLDHDLKVVACMAGLSLDIKTFIHTLSVVSLVQNDRVLASMKDELTEVEVLGINTTNQILAKAIASGLKDIN